MYLGTYINWLMYFVFCFFSDLPSEPEGRSYRTRKSGRHGSIRWHRGNDFHIALVNEIEIGIDGYVL